MNIEVNDNMIFQNSIKYLHSISILPQINIPALKSSLCLKRTLMELRKKIHLPTKATRPNMHCQRCFLNLYDGPATYKVKSKPTQYKFAEKILAKQKKGLPLTKYQQKYLEKNKNFSGNSLVTTCHFCQKETCTKLEKSITKSKPNIIVNSNSVTKKKKKKNKKDKLCGLNENVITSMVLNNNMKKKNKKLMKKKLFSSACSSQTQTTFDNSLAVTSNSSPHVCKNTSLNTLEFDKINKSSNKRPLEVITIESDDSLQEVPSKRKFKIKKKPEQILETSTPLITPKVKKKMERSRNKLSKLMKQSKNKDTSSDLMHLLQVSKNHSSEVITLDSDDSVQEFSIEVGKKKYPQLIHTSTPAITNKKKKKSNKLSEITNDSGKKKKSSIVLKFLQSL